jgi:hypothetical protein
LGPDEEDADARAIHALIERQFASLTWSVGTEADWATFASDFLPGANLYPSARPVRAQTVDVFISRIKGLAVEKLGSFHENVLGVEVRVFGNVAVAIAACGIVENGEDTSRGVEMLLLVKDAGNWRIASQAWDRECADRPIPADLLSKPMPR